MFVQIKYYICKQRSPFKEKEIEMYLICTILKEYTQRIYLNIR